MAVISNIPNTRSPGAGTHTTEFPLGCAAVTKSDTDTYDPFISVYVGVGGDVAIVPAVGDGSTAVTFKNMPSGSVLPCKALKVMSTNTTATDMVALF